DPGVRETRADVRVREIPPALAGRHQLRIEADHHVIEARVVFEEVGDRWEIPLAPQPIDRLVEPEKIPRGEARRLPVLGFRHPFSAMNGRPVGGAYRSDRTIGNVKSLMFGIL